MKTYAMVLLGNVIDVLMNQEHEPYYPPDPEGNPVIAVPCDNTVTAGMLYDEITGTFTEDNRGVPDPEAPEEPKSQLDRIEEKLDMLAEGTVDQEYLDYYNAVNAALTGGV